VIYDCFLSSSAYNRIARICATELAEKSDWQDLSALLRAQAGDRETSAGVPEELLALNGAIVKARILDVSAGSSENSVFIEASLRPSRVNSKKKSAALKEDPLPESGGELVDGYVVNTSSKGCFVRLSRFLTGRILVKDLSDDFVKDPAAAFPVGKLVRRAKVTEVSGDMAQPSSLHVRLSLRSADTGEIPEEEARELAKLSKGQVVTGRVHRIAQVGVFVSIDGTSLVGLSRPPLAVPGGASAGLPQLNAAFEVGDPVRALVLGVSGRKIALGLKSSLFRERTDEDDEDEEEAVEDEEEESEDAEEQADDSDAEDSADGEQDDLSDGVDGTEDEDEQDGLLQPLDGDSDEDSEVERMIREAALHDDDSEGSEADAVPMKIKDQAPRKKAKKAPEAEQNDDDTPNGYHFAESSVQKPAVDALFEWDDFKPASAQPVAAAEGVPSDSDDSDGSDDGNERTGGGVRFRQREQEKKVAAEKLRRREVRGNHFLPDI
jgi:rRNA biogenesis protein RRP5